MSGFKFRVLGGILLIVFIVIFCSILSYQSYNRHIKEEIRSEPSYPHTLSIYTSEGDTLLNMDTESEYVKIWVEDNGELDIWTLEENGWRRN